MRIILYNMGIENRINEVRALLEQANFAYYIDAMPTMADSEYDSLMGELLELEEKNPEFLDPNSPSQRVGGAPVPGFETVTHLVPMQSIDNTYTLSDLQLWHEMIGGSIECTCDPKIDGGAISLEPAGQLELSGAPLANIHQTCSEVSGHLQQVKAIAAEMGIGFIGLGYRPDGKTEDMPWMPKGRYKIMREYMPKSWNYGARNDAVDLHSSGQFGFRF